MSGILASILTPAKVASYVAENYGLVISRSVLLHRGFNDSYELATRDGPVIARVYRHGWRTRGQVEAELQILRDLAEADIPVSVPVARRDGAHFVVS